MSEVFDIFNVIIVVLIFFVLWVVVFRKMFGVQRAYKPTEMEKRNRIKEIKLLDELLTDIKENTHHWLYTGVDFSSLTNRSLINDKINLSIVVGRDGPVGDSRTLVINYNLKDLSKYRETDPNTVSIVIMGQHVSRFLLDADNLLDARGKEIDFFNQQIKTRL